MSLKERSYPCAYENEDKNAKFVAFRIYNW
jgi:hypothetical protein